MRSIVRFGVILSITCLAGASSAADFYYGTDGPIPVVTDSSKMLIQVTPTLTPDEFQTLLDSFERIVERLSDNQPVDEFVVCSLSTGAGYIPFLDSMQSVGCVQFAEPFYRLEDGSPLYIGQSFCVAFESTVTTAQIDNLNATYNVTIQRELRGMPNVYLLLNSPSSAYRTLELANIYHNLPEVRYAHPNFGFRIQKNAYRLFDYYHEYQFHTKKVIGNFNEASVWDFAGLESPITVSVVDDGVDSHEDLPAGRVTGGYNFADDDDDPRPGPQQSHGMACAGIIAASHSADSVARLVPSSGVISLIPHTRILPVQIFGDEGNAASNDSIAEAVTYAYTQGADILSNSWGYGSSTYDYPALTEALERASIFGRGGLGCPVIFSSGNTTWFYPNPEGVAYPARLDFCFAVGATQLDDHRWGYSKYGPALDIVAPSDSAQIVGVWTLDQMDTLGANFKFGTGSRTAAAPSDTMKFIDNLDCPPGADNINYHCGFSGTSAACPVVSGTAALLLSRDSTLSAQAVYYILRNSAVTHLDWGTINPPDDEYGHGRVDAYRAILSIARGDVSNDAKITIGDVSILIDHIFLSGVPIALDSLLGDISCDGAITIADISILIDHLFISGPIAAPLPLPCFEFND